MERNTRERKEKRGGHVFFRKPDRWQRLRQIMRECDVIIEIADARDIYNTRLPKVENWAGKERLIIVANKIDLTGERSEEIAERLKERGFFPLNSKSQKHSDREQLIQAILEKRPMRPLRVFVLGYPNVGKSALINMLAQRKAARVAAIAGTTRGIQWVRVHPQIMLLDSAGVFPEKLGKSDLFFRGAVNVDGLEDPEIYSHAAMTELLENEGAKKWLEGNFDIVLEKGDDAEKALEKIARRRNLLLKAGEPNVFEASRLFLRSLITAPILLRGAHIPKAEMPAERVRQERSELDEMKERKKREEMGEPEEYEGRWASRAGRSSKPEVCERLARRARGGEMRARTDEGRQSRDDDYGRKTRKKKPYEKRNRRHMGRR